MSKRYVISKNIVSLDYNEKTQELDVEFKGKKVYRYFPVSKELNEKLDNAASIGKTFHEFFIKNTSISHYKLSIADTDE